MVIPILVSGLSQKLMVMGFKLGKVENDTKVSGKWVLSMVKAQIFILMVQVI